jgi:hypothetical protein
LWAARINPASRGVLHRAVFTVQPAGDALFTGAVASWQLVSLFPVGTVAWFGSERPGPGAECGRPRRLNVKMSCKTSQTTIFRPVQFWYACGCRADAAQPAAIAPSGVIPTYQPPTGNRCVLTGIPSRVCSASGQAAAKRLIGK